MLSAIVREMHQTLKAYPLMDLASLFISKPDHCLIKLEGHKRAEGKPPITFFQCGQCKQVFQNEAGCEQHALTSHLDEFFDVETVEGRAPTGHFSCVGRCRRTGTLLGPPNHHTFQRTIQQMVANRFPHLTVQQYREQVDMVSDPELIEQWKNESKTQKRYRLKSETSVRAKAGEAPADVVPVKEFPPEESVDAVAGASAEPERREPEPDSASAVPESKAAATLPLDWEEAKLHFREHVLPRLVVRSHRITLPATVAQSMEQGPIKETIRECWMKESRFPLSISLAMRPAFRHMRLHVFRTNRKNVFVTAVKPKPLDPGAAIDSIRDELNYLRDHPGCHRTELVEVLRPGASLESPEVAEVVGNLRWLIEKGHIIEFYDGRLAVPSAKGGTQGLQPTRTTGGKEASSAGEVVGESS